MFAVRTLCMHAHAHKYSHTFSSLLEKRLTGVTRHDRSQLYQRQIQVLGGGGGATDGGCGWGGWGGGGTPPAPARGYGGALQAPPSEALQLYHIPIMKRVRKAVFTGWVALFNNNKTHMFTVLVYTL